MTQRKEHTEGRISILKPLVLSQERQGMFGLTPTQTNALEERTLTYLANGDSHAPLFLLKSLKAGLPVNSSLGDGFRQKYEGSIRESLQRFSIYEVSTYNDYEILTMAYGLKQLYPKEFERDMQQFINQYWMLILNRINFDTPVNYLMYHCLFPQVTYSQLLEHKKIDAIFPDLTAYVAYHHSTLASIGSQDGRTATAAALRLLSPESPNVPAMISDSAKRNSQEYFDREALKEDWTSATNEAYCMTVLLSPSAYITEDGHIVVTPLLSEASETVPATIPQVRRII